VFPHSSLAGFGRKDWERKGERKLREGRERKARGLGNAPKQIPGYAYDHLFIWGGVRKERNLDGKVGARVSVVSPFPRQILATPMILSMPILTDTFSHFGHSNAVIGRVIDYCGGHDVIFLYICFFC